MDVLFFLALLGVYSGIAIVVAHFLGRKRQIGFGLSFFFCLFLHPIGGLITTLLSRKYHAPNPERSNLKKVLGCILIVLSLIGFHIHLMRGLGDASTFKAFATAIGFVGLGFYLIALGKGKTFNVKSSTKTDE